MRRPISALLALLLLTGSAAAFACESYCTPSRPDAAAGNAASEHGAHAHHHAAAAPARPAASDSILSANAGHPPQCSVSAETPRAPRVVRSTNDGTFAPVTPAPALAATASLTASAVRAPSPPPSPPLSFALPLRI